MADVDVEIGAKIDDLTAKVGQVNASLAGIGSQASRMSGFMAALGKTLATAFSIEGVVRYTMAMGALGERTEILGARLGQTAEQIGVLDGIATLSGTTVDALTSSIERLSLGIQRSTRDAFSPQSAALRQLGLDANELIGLPTDEYFRRIADATAKFNPSLNLTNALMQIGGRQLAQMVPILQQGSAGWDAMRKKIEETGRPTTEQTSRFAAFDDQIDLLVLSIQGLGVQVFSYLEPAFKGIAKTLTDFVQWVIKSTKEGGVFAGALNLLSFAAKGVATALASVLSIMQGLAEATAMFLTIPTKGMAALTQFGERVEEIGRKYRDTLRGIWAPEITVNKPPGQNMGGLGDPRGDAMMARERLEAQRVVNEEALKQQKLFLDHQVEMERITSAQSIAAYQEKLAAYHEADIRLMEQERALFPQRSQEWERINAEILASQQRHNTEMLNLNFQLVRAWRDQFMEFGEAVSGAWNNQVRGLLAGTTSWAQAFRSVLADLIVQFAQWLSRKLILFIANEAAERTAMATSATAKVATEQAATTATLPLRIAKFTSDITADAARVFAGIFASLAPVMGPAAAGPAAAGQATVLAQMVNVPKFDVGAWSLPSNMLAQVHQGEMIVPAGPAEALRNILSGGGTAGGSPVNVYLSAIDPAHGAQFLMRNKRNVGRAMQGDMKRRNGIQPNPLTGGA